MKSPEQPRRRVRKSRGKGMRTTTGCLTCRKRHKKCDERRPVCGPCSISSRDCVYGSIQPRQDDARPRDSPTATSPLQTTRESELNLETIVDQAPSLPGVAALVNEVHVPSSLQPARPLASGTSPHGHPQYTSNPGTQLAQVIQRLDDGQQQQQVQYVYSPETVSSELLTADLASTRWLDLLAADAAQADAGFSLAPSRPQTRAPSPVAGPRLPPAEAHHASSSQSQAGLQQQPLQLLTPSSQGAVIRPGAGESLASQIVSSPQVFTSTEVPAGQERHDWQLDQDIPLKTEEAALFRIFAERAALWLDLFDPYKHFSTHATRLALRNLGLMKAILALTSRHAIATTQTNEADVSVPVQYYYETLHFVQEALQYTSYTRSQELLATVIIISTYEMLDESNSNWKRHLKGVFWIQRSQDVNGASGGLRQSVWWAWLRQDLWAAFREKRPCFSFWKPTKDLPELSQDQLANRAVYLLSQCVNYCASCESSTVQSVGERIQRGDALMAALQRWRTFLGPAYQPLPTPASETGPHSHFKPIWIHPPQFAAAMQIYNFAKILITLHRPAAAGFQGYMQTQRVLSDAVDTICGIAMELKDEGCQILSAQCLFGAGLCTQDPVKREAILSLIKSCEMRTGWPMSTMTDDLKADWAKLH